MKNIRKETNRYAASRITLMRRQEKLNRKSMWHRWLTLFAIVLHTCVLKLHDMNDYWTGDTVLATRFARKLLSRDNSREFFVSYVSITNAHYVKRGEEGHDPVYKMNGCKFRGRVSFRIYMQNKPNKHGMKWCILCDAATGSVLNCDVYRGAAGNVNDDQYPGNI
ncbi:hypothetical protein PR048_010530 [Dryococelus australis]|uniref:PiggyBac transposable element-derived protein domain-containing protein n=1 Tax=Dryococelus australis TaxID=614101 RepID=A0ABQ9I3U8_9NEOP|nr:hypothetical protein PR048_010530 [Dryococelus australis]